MRILLTGSRNFGSRPRHLVHLDEVLSPLRGTFLHGACPFGLDHYADKWLVAHNRIVERYPANWSLHGRKAGPIRNEEMIKTMPNKVLASWDGVSPGTRNTLTLAKRYGIPVEVHYYGVGSAKHRTLELFT